MVIFERHRFLVTRVYNAGFIRYGYPRTIQGVFLNLGRYLFTWRKV